METFKGRNHQMLRAPCAPRSDITSGLGRRNRALRWLTNVTIWIANEF